MSAKDREENANPMLIEVILENMFKYCDFKELSCYREVCRPWYNASFKMWLASAPPIHLGIIPPRLTVHSWEKIIGIDKFFQQFHQKGSTIPLTSHPSGEVEDLLWKGIRAWQRFQISDHNLNVLMHPDYSGLTQFWPMVGRWTTHLEITVTFPDHKTYEDIMLSRDMPYLKTLVANISFPRKFKVVGKAPGGGLPGVHGLKSLRISLPEREDRGDSGIGWMRLFQRYPHLKKLEVDTWNWQELKKMVIALRVIRALDKNSVDLKAFALTLDYKEHLPSEHAMSISLALAQLWRESQLSLQSCQIQLPKLDTKESDLLVDALNFQDTTVKALTIKTGGFGCNLLPPMTTSVQILDLQGGTPFRNISFLHSYPNLSSLKLEEGQAYVMVRADKEDRRKLLMSSLASFHCVRAAEDKYGSIHSGTDIQKLSQIMPNISTLKMRLTNGTFRAVTVCWPRLEHLTIFGTGVNDKGLTGRVGGRKRISQNITNLTDLLSLCIITDADPWNSMLIDRRRHRRLPAEITEKSALHGFLKLPKLQKLHLCVTSMEEEMVDELKQKIGDFQIEIRNDGECLSDHSFKRKGSSSGSDGDYSE